VDVTRQKPEDGAAVSTHIIVEDPAFLIVAVALVLGLLWVVLGERVVDAFVEDLFGAFRA